MQNKHPPNQQPMLCFDNSLAVDLANNSINLDHQLINDQNGAEGALVLIKAAADKFTWHSGQHLHSQGQRTQEYQETDRKSLITDCCQLNSTGNFDGCLGIINMNMEHNYNMLTPSFIGEINRGIATMDVAQSVSTVYMAPQLGQMFSNGTDFRLLARMQKEGSNDAITKYLEQLYQLQVQMASFNKPLVAVAPGHSYNSGATLLAASGIPLVNNASKLAFNEATFGFVPHAGATYYLSRLPGEFGTFLALTGMRIDGSDAIAIGLAQSAVQDPLLMQEEVGEIVRSQEYRPNYGSEYFEKNTRDKKWLDMHYNGPQRRAFDEFRNSNMLHQMDANRLANGNLEHGRYEEFIEAKDRIPSAVADAEYRYMQMLRHDESLHNEKVQSPYLSFGQGELDRENMFLFNDSYKAQHQYLSMFLNHWHDADIHVAIKHKQMIDRCFYPRTVNEIIDNLKKEVHPFAKECLAQMERNSKVSMQLAREMMHRAQNLDYTGCMQMELNVALNRIKDADFALGVDKVLRTKAPQVDGKKVARKNPGFKTDELSESQLQSYFEETPLSKKVNIGAVRYALLPTRHHFERFTDHLRIWINEANSADERVRTHFDEQAKEALRMEGIDVRDKALTIKDAREHLAAKLAKERVQEVRNQRFDQIMLDQQLQEKYFVQVTMECNKLVSDQTRFYERVNQHISDIFDLALSERLDKIYNRSKEAQSLEKRRMFVRLKKFMFKNRVLTYSNETFKTDFERLKNFPYRLPHGQEHPEQSWHDVAHPQLEKSPLHVIAKAIGRVSLTPVEITKEYLTNPERRNQLSMLTLDRSELDKLQNDVLQNPEKYIQMFTKPEAPVENLQNLRGRTEEKFEVGDFWWRMYNDMATPLDNWPKRTEFDMYKAWAEDVEKSAIDTLRNCLSQLLVSVSEHETIRPQFTKEMNKRSKLKHLMALISEAGNSESQTEPKVLKKIEATSGELDQLHSYVQKLLSDDSSYQLLYKREMDGQLSTNPRIVKLRQEAENEILQLIEIVLLDKYGRHTTAEQRAQLNSRLKSLLQPRGAELNSNVIKKQLGVIDQYLDQEMRHESLRDALDIIKPFFANIFQRKLQQQASDLLDEMQWKTTNHVVQLHYFGDIFEPGFSKGLQLEQRIMNPDTAHAERMEIEKAWGENSPHFERRQIQTEWTSRASMHEDPEYQKLSLQQKKTHEIREAKRRENQVSKVDVQILIDQFKSDGVNDPTEILTRILSKQGGYSEQVAAVIDSLTDENIAKLKANGFSNNQIKVLQKLSEAKKQLEQSAPNPRKFDFNEVYEHLKSHEKNQIDTLKQRELSIIHFLESIQYEMDHNITAFDWLKMYAKVIENTDFNSVIEDYHYFTQKLRAREKLSDKDMLLGVTPDFEYQKPSNLLKTPAEWEEIKEYCEFLNDFFTAQTKVVSEQATVDLEQYMSTPSTDGKSIFERALADRNEFVANANAKKFVNRNLFINDAIADFNAVQQQKQRNQKLRDEIRTSAASKPMRIRDLVDGLLSNNYVDLPTLKQRLEKGKLEANLGELVNRERLLADLKTKPDLIPGFQDKFAKMSIDVLSLDEAKTMIDYELSGPSKTHALEVIDHISTSAMTVGNEQRKSITIGQFLGSTHDKYSQYASNLLEQKLKDALGQANQKEPQSIDWELGRSRTSPYDLNNPKSRAEVDALIQRVIDSKEEDTSIQLGYFDAEVHGFRSDPERQHELKKVLFDAADCTTLPKDLEQVKAIYENRFLKALTTPDDFEKVAQPVIAEYTDIRMQQCMLQPDFARKVRSKYGYLYVKMLRERVMDELKITKETPIEDLEFGVFMNEKAQLRKSDIEAKYNVQHIEGLGFDNLLERASKPTAKGQADAAQKNVLDKLLADYFVGRKHENAEANKLIYDLAAIFEDNQASNSFDTIQRKYNLQQVNKEEKKGLHFEAFKDMMDLDVITSRAIQNNKNGLSAELRQMSITESGHSDHWLTQVPDYFEMMDVRKPADKVVDDRLFIMIKQAFDVRKNLEQKMTRRELLAFDQVLARHLELEHLGPRLKECIQEELNLSNIGRQIVEHRNNNEFNDNLQGLKREDPQREFNKSIKDPDAQFKSLAFATMLEQQGRAIMEKPGKSSPDKLELQYIDSTFPRWYLRELEKDAHRAPRNFNHDDFRHKKQFEMPPANAQFMNKKEREEALFEDQKVYLENKKEQQQRMQTFYILEQFFESARTKPDSTSEAQKAIKEYFSKPENTFFFDKNKI